MKQNLEELQEEVSIMKERDQEREKIFNQIKIDEENRNRQFEEEIFKIKERDQEREKILNQIKIDEENRKKQFKEEIFKIKEKDQEREKIFNKIKIDEEDTKIKDDEEKHANKINELSIKTKKERSIFENEKVNLVLRKAKTINEALEKLYPKGSEDKFFVADGHLITDKSESPSKYSANNIQILDIKEKTITLEFNCKEFHIDSILITKKNIQIMNSLADIKEEIIDITKIDRDARYLIVNNEKTIEITEEMLSADKNIKIPLDVSFKPARFIIKTDNGNKKIIQIACDSIKCLENIYHCDKIQLFDDEQLLEDDTNFLNLKPLQEYKILLFDKYFLSTPKFKKSNDPKEENIIISGKEITEIYLQRFRTINENLNNKFKEIPFLVFYEEKNITDYEISKKITTSSDKPLVLKINFRFNIKKGVCAPKLHNEALDDFNVKVKKFIASKIFQLTTTDRVEAKMKSKDDKIIKEIGNDDTFGKLNYKKGYTIETILLPPNLEFKVDQLDIVNIQINKEIELPKEFKMRFPEKTTAAEAKGIICAKYLIKNDIIFEKEKDKVLDDGFLMFDIPESSFITIKLLPPSYIFVFDGTEYVINLKTNLTFKEVLTDPKFKSKIQLHNPYHSLEFSVTTKKGKVLVFDEDSKIFDFYKKGIKINFKEI